VCGPVASWASQCPGALKCTVNRCGGACTPEFTGLNTLPMCTGLSNDLCPDGTAPVECAKGGVCAGVDSSQLDTLGCSTWEEATRCVSSACGGCFASWTNDVGKPVCPTVLRLEGAVATLEELENDWKEGAPATLEDATFAVMPVATKETEARGDVDIISVPETAEATEENVVEREGEVILITERTVATVETNARGEEGIPVCPLESPFVQCRSNPCDFAQPPRCREARGLRLTCEPSYCGGCTAQWKNDGADFMCPADVRCEPGAEGCCDSGRPPVDCTSQTCPVDVCFGATRCEMDACRSCAVAFYDVEDKKIPRGDCRGPPVPSSTRPPPREPCNPLADEQCCPDRLLPFDCPLGMAERICPGLVCDAHDVAECYVDGCDYCNVHVKDSAGSEVNVLRQCHVPPPKLDCPDVQCPDIEPYCGERPSSCAGVELECILDACTCISMWVDVRHGSPPRCSESYRPPCIPAERCPLTFACPEPPSNLNLPAVILDALTCVQEACTCRPIVTLGRCIQSDECPPTTPASCGPLPAAAQDLPAEVLARFLCLPEQCTCKPAWSSPQDLTPEMAAAFRGFV
jgi:hypothetical protein